MRESQARASTAWDWDLADPRVGVTPLVVAVEGVPSSRAGSVLATALAERPAQVTLDLAGDRIVVTPYPGQARTVLVPTGPLRTGTLPMLHAVLQAALRSRPGQVVVDLRHVESIDAAGERALARAATRMSSWGGVLTVRDPHPGARPPVAGHPVGPVPVAASRPQEVPTC